MSRGTETMSVSVPRELAAELRAAARRTGLPIGRIVAQGARIRLDELVGLRVRESAVEVRACVNAACHKKGPVALAARICPACDHPTVSAGLLAPEAYGPVREGPTATVVDYTPTAAEAAELRAYLLRKLDELSGAEATIEDPFPGTTEVR